MGQDKIAFLIVGIVESVTWILLRYDFGPLRYSEHSDAAVGGITFGIGLIVAFIVKAISKDGKEGEAKTWTSEEVFGLLLMPIYAGWITVLVIIVFSFFE